MTELSDIENIEFTIPMPLMQLPARTTLVRLARGVVMFSPGPNIDFAAAARFGPVTDIVAPTLFHNLGVERAIASLPKAKLRGVPGFSQKIPAVDWGQELAAGNWPYQDELPMVQLQGMPKVNEAVFVHKKSRTLLVADLVFNVRNPRGLGAWLILNMFGTYRRFGVSRLFQRMVVDKTAFERSLGEVFSHQFDNILMSHGDALIGGGRECLRDALLQRGFRPAAV